MATIKDDANVEADFKYKWFQDHCNERAQRAKSTEEKTSSEIFCQCRAEEDLEVSKSKVAELERELKVL